MDITHERGTQTWGQFTLFVEKKTCLFLPAKLNMPALKQCNKGVASKILAVTTSIIDRYIKDLQKAEEDVINF